MSKRVLRYEDQGPGRPRKPIYDEGDGGATAAATDAMSRLSRLTVPTSGLTGGAGPVEKRQATEAQRAAWREADADPPLVPKRSPVTVDAAMTAVSRQRGATANRTRIASERTKPIETAGVPAQPGPRPMSAALDRPPSPRHQEEEPAMVEALESPESPADIPEIIPAIGAPPATLTQLADAAIAAAEAWDALEEADVRWEAARTTLVGLWDRVGLAPSPARRLEILGDLAAAIDRVESVGPDDSPAVQYAIDEVDAALVAPEGVTGPAPDATPTDDVSAKPDPSPAAVAPPIGGGSEDPELSRLSTFERKVLQLAIEHRGDRRKVAELVGTKHVQSVDQTLERIGKKDLLPIDLIPFLPARFAKYATA